MNAIQRFVQAYATRFQPGTVAVRNYIVTVVTPAASRDGRAQVSILVGSTNLAVPYLDSYTSPVVGDVVSVLFTNGSPIILGRPAGLPTF